MRSFISQALQARRLAHSTESVYAYDIVPRECLSNMVTITHLLPSMLAASNSTLSTATELKTLLATASKSTCTHTMPA